MAKESKSPSVKLKGRSARTWAWLRQRFAGFLLFLQSCRAQWSLMLAAGLIAGTASLCSATVFAATYAEGMSKYQQGDLAGAERIFASMSAATGKDQPGAFKMLGICQYLEGQKDAAAQSFKRALSLNPGLNIAPGEALDDQVIPLFNQQRKAGKAKSVARPSQGPSSGATASAASTPTKKGGRQPGTDANGNPLKATFLTVTSDTKGANITIDGIIAGQVNHQINTDPGSVMLEISAPGFKTQKVRVKVAKNADNRITVNLKKPQPKVASAPRPARGAPQQPVARDDLGFGDVAQAPPAASAGASAKNPRQPKKAAPKQQPYTPAPADDMFPDQGQGAALAGGAGGAGGAAVAAAPLSAPQPAPQPVQLPQAVPQAVAQQVPQAPPPQQAYLTQPQQYPPQYQAAPNYAPQPQLYTPQQQVYIPPPAYIPQQQVYAPPVYQQPYYQQPAYPAQAPPQYQAPPPAYEPPPPAPYPQQPAYQQQAVADPFDSASQAPLPPPPMEADPAFREDGSGGGRRASKKHHRSSSQGSSFDTGSSSSSSRGGSKKKKKSKSKSGKETMIDLLPLGAGQFQNGQPMLGIFFAAAQIGGIGFGYYENSQADSLVSKTNAYQVATCANATDQTTITNCNTYIAQQTNVVKSDRQYGLYAYLGGGIAYGVSVIQALLHDGDSKPKKSRRSSGSSGFRVSEEDGEEPGEQLEDPSLYAFNWNCDLAPRYSPVTNTTQPQVMLRLSLDF